MLQHAARLQNQIEMIGRDDGQRLIRDAKVAMVKSHVACLYHEQRSSNGKGAHCQGQAALSSVDDHRTWTHDSFSSVSLAAKSPSRVLPSPRYSLSTCVGAFNVSTNRPMARALT